MAKVSINLNEKFPSEEDEYVDDSAGTLDSVDPPSAAEGKEQINGPADPPVSNVDAGASSKEAEQPKASVARMGAQAAGSSAPVDDIQRKIRRAERFGVPVQLSEQEKRNSRAERFGTGSGMMKSEGLTKSEELKRKARAERFGVSVSSTPVDEESKKKARFERFYSNPKTVSEEEDKRKARAIRFSNLPSSLPQVNSETAVAGGASGGA